jgi:ribosome-associated translation inhibitor RaiA
MRLFAQSLTGEVKEWFRGLPAGSIHSFHEFETIFLGKWERKKNSLHLLTQYNNLRRNPNESVQDFSHRFKKTYDAIPTNVKPPPGVANLHYADAFNSEFTLLLRERRFVSLEDMMDDATEVEVNLSASHRNKQRHETKRVKDEEPQASTSSSNLDAKHDTMMKALERLMVKLSSNDKNQMKNQREPQVKNPNFRRQQGPPIPQVMPREPRNPNEQQIRPHF